ncbi:response regulator [Microbaculum marinum]|uniref:Regulatory protein VirG n=1 Tax=Microbaculum marinum TaxID=1764581 RepID=A0AAW9RRJ7_9HYPH
MSGNPHILVVDDDAEVREMVRDYLLAHDFVVSTAEDGAAMKSVLAQRPVNVVVLDLKMPGDDGFTLTRYLRERGPVGIIMLTGSGEVIDRVVGLELGADDYLTKPFDPRELLARVRSLVRRLSSGDAAHDEAPATMGHEVVMGRCILNLDTKRLYHRDGDEVPMTAMEFDLLRSFAERPNRVLSRDQLLDLAHNRDMEAFDRSIDIRIMRLRRKIEPDPQKPEVLKTIRGLGYMFVPAGQRQAN